MRLTVAILCISLLPACALNWRSGPPRQTELSAKAPAVVAGCLVKALDAAWERHRLLPWDRIEHQIRTIELNTKFEVAPINDIGDDFVRVSSEGSGGSRIEAYGLRWRFFEDAIKGCA